MEVKVKKIMTVALVLGAMYSTANAIEIRPYVGLEGSFSMTKVDNDYLIGGDSGLDDKNNNFNIGINGGLQFDINEKFYLGGEIYLNTGKLFDEDKSNHYELGGSDYGDEYTEAKLNQYFGFRINAGYNFNDKISAFAFIGLNYNEYESKFSDEDTGGAYFHGKYDDTFMSPSFGLGVTYNFTKNLQAKLSYEFSKFTVEDHTLYLYEYYFGSDYLDEDIDVTVNTFRLGINYLF